jgi:hypothetical protein
LKNGYNYFGSGSVNSVEFNEFFTLFKKSFTKELKSINAENIVFSKGHFYLSGFFTVQNQVIYFSLSDVRTDFSKEKLLVRTATSYTDYTGGVNQYVKIQKNIGYEILLTFNLDTSVIENPTKLSIKEKCVLNSVKIYKELESNRRVEKTIASGSQAFWTMYGIVNLMGFNEPITETKIGRKLLSLSYKGHGTYMFYDYMTKKLTVEK